MSGKQRLNTVAANLTPILIVRSRVVGTYAENPVTRLSVQPVRQLDFSSAAVVRASRSSLRVLRSKARPSAARGWRQSCRLRVLRTSRSTAACSDAPRESR